MSTGLSLLHRLDDTISKARARTGEASELAARAADALLDLQRRQTEALGQIAHDRLDILETGDGGDLGYVDRQAEKLLDAHEDAVNKANKQLSASEKAIEKLEANRRTQEALTAKAVDAYDKTVAKAEAALLENAAYNTQLETVDRLERTVIRAEEKLLIAQDDETKKGEPYRNDPFFTYLQKRGYGTRKHKGWFLTKWLDGGVARLAGYRQAAENYRRLTAIPVRLASHVENLEGDVISAQQALQKIEADWLVSQGVSTKHEASLAAQKKLDDIDANIAASEQTHETLSAERAALIAGDAGPYQQAVTLMSETLASQNMSNLRRLAAQTRTREDDAAVEILRDLSQAQDDLLADQKEAKTLLGKYQRTLSGLQSVRQNFKARRYDAPSSSFKRANLIVALMTQVLAGERPAKDLWNQMTRNQRTNKRYSDTDFGGGDWTEGLRLPRTTGRGRSGSWGRRNSGIDIGDVFGVLEGISRSSGGGWGGGRRSGGWGRTSPAPTRRRRRTSIPRSPRIRLPKSGGFGGGGSFGGFGGGRRGGGFKTGGGF